MKSFNVTTAALLGGMMMVGSAQGALVGHWEFENSGDLTAATVGADLVLTGSDAAVAGSGGADTGAALVGDNSFYTMTHGIAAGTGGGTLVNAYSVLFDISYPTTSDGVWKSLFQTSTTNSNDGDLFIHTGTDRASASNATGIGLQPMGGYSSNAAHIGLAGKTNPDTWYRVILSVENGVARNVYVDGALWMGGNTGTLDDRMGLGLTALILADENGDEDPVNLSNLAIFDTALTANEAAALGAAGAAVPEPGSLALLGLGGLMIARRRRA